LPVELGENLANSIESRPETPRRSKNPPPPLNLNLINRLYDENLGRVATPPGKSNLRPYTSESVRSSDGSILTVSSPRVFETTKFMDEYIQEAKFLEDYLKSHRRYIRDNYDKNYRYDKITVDNIMTALILLDAKKIGKDDLANNMNTFFDKVYKNVYLKNPEETKFQLFLILDQLYEYRNVIMINNYLENLKYLFSQTGVILIY